MVEVSRVRLIGSFVFVFVFALFLFTQKMASEEILTNETIEKMVKADLSEDIIVRMIQLNPANFTLTSETLIDLQKKGVSDKILSAMLAKQAMVQDLKATGERQAVPPKGSEPLIRSFSVDGPPSFDGGCRGIDTRRTNEVSTITIGHCRFSNVTLKMLINVAYGFRITPGKLNETIIGGPEWVNSDRFELETQSADEGSATENQLRQSLQTLLKNRFKLEFHHGNKTGLGTVFFVIDHAEKPSGN
jgi:hypothetical protein